MKYRFSERILLYVFWELEKLSVLAFIGFPSIGFPSFDCTFFNSDSSLKIVPIIYQWAMQQQMICTHLGSESQSSMWNGPYISNFKLAVVNVFTNVLEIKTTRMYRGDCWENVYAKNPFCVPVTLTAFLIDQCPFSKSLLYINRVT